MQYRKDISEKGWILNPFLTPKIAPFINSSLQAGVFPYAPFTPALSAVQTGRATGGAITQTTVSHTYASFTTAEKIESALLDDRIIGFYGSKEKAIVNTGMQLVTNVTQQVEAATATGLFDSTNLTTIDASVSGLTLPAAIDQAVQALRDVAGVSRIGLVCSDYIWTTLILADSDVKTRLAAPANAVINLPDAKRFGIGKVDMFAGEFLLDEVLIGGTKAWYTGVTNKNYCVVFALPNTSMDQITEVRLGSTVVYNYPEFGPIMAGNYYEDAKHGEVVDVWANTVYSELNPEYARLIKIA